MLHESTSLASEKRVIEERLTSLNTARTPSPGRLNQMRLEHICKVIADWLDRAGKSERELALDALQVTVEATKDEATVSGVLPVDHPPFIMNKQSCRCSFNGDKLFLGRGVPFKVKLTL